MGKASQLLASKRGAVSTEYVILVGSVGLLFIAAVAALGPGLVKSYEVTRAVMASPFP